MENAHTDGGMALLAAVGKFKGHHKKKKKRHRRSTVNKAELGGAAARVRRRKTKANMQIGGHGGGNHHIARKATMQSIAEDAQPVRRVSRARPKTDREALERLYARVDPAKLANIDAILKNFETNRDRTIALIEAKYPGECEWPAVNDMHDLGVTDDMFDAL